MSPGEQLDELRRRREELLAQISRAHTTKENVEAGGVTRSANVQVTLADNPDLSTELVDLPSEYQAMADFRAGPGDHRAGSANYRAAPADSRTERLLHRSVSDTIATSLATMATQHHNVPSAPGKRIKNLIFLYFLCF